MMGLSPKSSNALISPAIKEEEVNYDHMPDDMFD